MKKNQEIGSLLLRVILGFTFFMHGMDKFQGGVENFAAGFPSMGLPSFLAYFVAFIELVGGISLIIGIGTRIFSGLIACIMIGAIMLVKLRDGFLGGYEFDVVLMIIALYLVLNGSYLLSVDSKLLQLKSASSRKAHEESPVNERTS
ncbi:DoxX family protein [Metabacillus rhizolycopersici]|uniref:DoxX family protein n=1 Tax=Metabacillus rhizolycopersici TaxID=2875709 RepID=A0ABS7UZB6_9BACI|nr:DoxX family protein [Metabacillus rhizolycopersici]MBZ5753348.1 DoxX family protein [Metabacillus rhizolycopersici]